MNTLNLICEKGESIQEDGSVAEADLLGKHSMWKKSVFKKTPWVTISF